ncbi:MAG: DoxX family protein [Aggregatilineales bacterium]
MNSINFKKYARWLLGVIFIFAGVAHFIAPEFYLPMMPPFLPLHLELVYLSGVLEILGGVLLFVPKYTRYTGYFLIALMLAVFPANIYMALNPDEYPDIPMLGLYARLPLQFVLIAFIYWATQNKLIKSAENLN